MGDLRFFSLGSGSSGNCYFLGTQHYGILIDIGFGQRRIQKRLKDKNISFEQIYGILLTHAHADHVRGANAISKNFHIPFFATTETFSLISSGFRSQYNIENIDRKDINIEEEFNIGEFNIKAFPLSHDVPTVGYRIQFRDKVFTVATDLGNYTPYLENLVSESDYIVLESNYDKNMLENGPYPYLLKQRITGGQGHLSNEQASTLIKNNITPKTKYIFLCHLSSHNNTPEKAETEMKKSLLQNTRLVVLPRLEPTLMIDL